MKVCLIYPPSSLSTLLTHTIPMGIYVVGSILKENGIDVTLLDQRMIMQYLEKNIKPTKEIFSEDPIFKNAVLEADILGLSTDSFNYSMAKTMICSAKELNPRIKVILGGIHPTLFDEHVIKTSGADVVVRGEAEKNILELIRRLAEGKSFSDLMGITYLATNGAVIRNPDAPLCSPEDLARLSKIDYQLIPDRSILKAIPLENSRGCLFKCRFCSVLPRGTRRLFPLEYVKNAIAKVSNLKDTILFTDDCLTSESQRAKEIFFQVEKIDNLFIGFEARASDLAKNNGDILEPLSKGKFRMQVGVECGYDEGLIKIRKGTSISQVEKACQVVFRRDMAQSTILSFIVGFPWEGTKECIKTIDFAKKMRSEYGVLTTINFWIPAPSELWEETKSDFGVDESLYDKISWFDSDEIFRKTHPLINPRDKNKLDFIRRNSKDTVLF